MTSRRANSILGGLALACLAAAFAVLAPGAAFADESDATSMQLTVPEIFHCEYTGGDITFELDADDFEEGSKAIVDQGNLNWWANSGPWELTVYRSVWVQTEGEDWDPDPLVNDIHLQVKYGPPDNDNWYSVYTYAYAPPWITGDEAGSGTYYGLDWKVKQIGWDDPAPYGPPPPGTYTCTVTFTIKEGS